MNCPQCGSLLDDDAKFCEVCGTVIEDKAAEKPADLVASDNTAQVQETVKTEDKKKLSFDFSYLKDPVRILGIIVGMIFLIAGFMRVSDASVYIESASFGGDFYTYTYRGITVIARELAELERALGWLIAAIGAAIDVKAIMK